MEERREGAQVPNRMRATPNVSTIITPLILYSTVSVLSIL